MRRQASQAAQPPAGIALAELREHSGTQFEPRIEPWRS
jgi:hypothetical protein